MMHLEVELKMISLLVVNPASLDADVMNQANLTQNSAADLGMNADLSSQSVDKITASHQRIVTIGLVLLVMAVEVNLGLLNVASVQR